MPEARPGAATAEQRAGGRVASIYIVVADRGAPDAAELGGGRNRQRARAPLGAERGLLERDVRAAARAADVADQDGAAVGKGATGGVVHGERAIRRRPDVSRGPRHAVVHENGIVRA